jgi:hypothetical protein
LLTRTVALAQTDEPQLTEQDWDRLIPALVQEDWAKAEPLAASYLARFTTEAALMGEEAATVRYMYLKCVSGLLAQKKLTKPAALAKLKGFEGRPVLTPSRPFRLKGLFNCFKLDETERAFFCCSANEGGSQIHTFETFEPADAKILAAAPQLENKEFRLGAIIQRIEAGGVTLPHLVLQFTQAQLFAQGQE